MTISTDRFTKAIAAFDTYNANDPNREEFGGNSFSKEFLYAQRMTEWLGRFAPTASESVKLAARCQHIGRWEIPRSTYPMNKKGYLQWRSEEKMHHAKIAEKILADSGYDSSVIEKVKLLLLKKELHSNADSQLLEDVVCLVFIEYYLEEFAAKHDGEKVIDIIRKTAKKMSAGAIDAAGKIQLSKKMQSMLQQALLPGQLFKFEEEFMKGTIRCIPMIVRFKLDASGIKLKLAEWNQFTLEERTGLATLTARTEAEIINYRKHVQQLVKLHANEDATDLPVEHNPAWMQLTQLQESLLKKLSEFNWTLSVQQWQSLSDLQRFVLLKLSRPNHENKNFPKAMVEFGLVE